jgi:hypothetical protein
VLVHLFLCVLTNGIWLLGLLIWFLVKNLQK